MNWIALYQIFFTAFAVSAISVTITKAKIFAPLREWVRLKSEWFGDLMSCPYCLSHWIAIVFVLIYLPDMFSLHLVIDLIVATFLMVAISAIVTGAITKLNYFSEEKKIENFNNATKKSPW